MTSLHDEPRRTTAAVRYRRALCLALGATVLAVATSTRAAAPGAKAPLIESVGAVGITVSDLDRSIAFYRDVLAFSVAQEEETKGPPLERLTGVFGAHVRSARLVLGDQAIVLTEYLAPRGRPVPPNGHSNDRDFQHVAIVVADMDRAYQQLRQHHVPFVSTEPQTLPTWNKAAAGIRAFYFSDPDEHTLELIWFPPGKGDPRWQRASGPGAPQQALFLGIDHTAIAVGDTERSLRFYRDTLGMRVAGASENYGTEQEHLNAVFGAHLRITALRAASGPGIEFLEYLSPRDGRPVPADLHANDLSHWQTVLRARDLPAALTSATAAGAAAAPGAATDLADATYRFSAAALVNDPDGHGLLLAH